MECSEATRRPPVSPFRASFAIMGGSLVRDSHLAPIPARRDGNPFPRRGSSNRNWSGITPVDGNSNTRFGERTLHWIVVLVSLALLATNGMAGTYFPYSPCGAWLLVLIGGFLLLRRKVPVESEANPQAPAGTSPGKKKRHPRTGWIVLLTLVLLLADVPLRVTFWFSRPTMDQFAQEIMQLPPGTKGIPDRWIGAYPAYGIWRYEGGMGFRIGKSFWGGSWFFIYSQNGQRPYMPPANYMHFGGPWFVRIPSD